MTSFHHICKFFLTGKPISTFGLNLKVLCSCLHRSIATIPYKAVKMDGVSAASSVIAAIQITQQIFTICHTYYWEVKNARRDIQLLSNEVASLKDVLTNLKDLGDSSTSAELSSLRLLNQPNGPLDRCRTDLEALIAQLEPGMRTGDSKMKQFELKALKWPFSSKDVHKVIAVIERNKTFFNLALSSDQMYVRVLLFIDCHFSSKCQECRLKSSLTI